MRVLFWLSIGLDRRTPSEHLLTAIVESLYAQGHTVHILQKNTRGDKSSLPQRMIDLGVTTTRILSVQPQKSDLVARYLTDIQYVCKCWTYLRKAKGFDCVFLQSSNVAGMQVFALRHLLRKIPIIFNVQDIFPENAVYCHSIGSKSIAYRILSSIQQYAYRHVNRIITISEDMKDQLVEIGTPEEKIEVIYNWSYQDQPYDLTTLDYTRVAPFFDPQKFNVVYAGNIGRMQNVELVIQAAAKMRDQEDIMFHVFGDGVHKEKLVALAQKLDACNVQFHPMLDATDAPALYASADVNVIPLAKNIYRTALPSKTATCLACGKPIIFAIGTESKFGQKMQADAGCRLIDSDDVDGLCNEIELIRRKTATSPDIVFTKKFSKRSNSTCYSELILKSGLN